jgi:hypothetical protein
MRPFGFITRGMTLALQGHTRRNRGVNVHCKGAMLMKKKRLLFATAAVSLCLSALPALDGPP